ncbi:MAG: translocation/assembly module TamB domain-containing protein [Brachymonas sp.]|nr:translocation/assembly module TamB domain-containing protein [Brachymonas sp.]
MAPQDPSDHPQVPQAPPPPAPLTRRQRAVRVVRRTAYFSSLGLLAFVVLAVLAMSALFHWSKGEQSLATMLQVLQRQMPAGMSLQAEGVSGTLRTGGHIRKLVLRQYPKEAPVEAGALVLTLEDLDIEWDWTALRDRSTKFNKLHARRLQLADQRTQPSSDAPSAPLQELVLPVGIDAPFTADLIEIVPRSGKTTVLGPLTGRYRYDRLAAQHQLDVEKLQYGDGSYRAKATLGGRAPLALQAEASGQLHLPASASMPAQDLQLAVVADGTLAEPDGAIRVQAQAQPAQASANADGTQVKLDARIHPWQPQPVQEVQAQWQQLNLQDFWQAGPRTALQGSLDVRPAPADALPVPVASAASAPVPVSGVVAEADEKVPGLLGFLGPGRWQGKLQTRNGEAGAWDKNRLPLHTLESTLEYHHGALQLDQFRWQLAPQGGAIAGQAKYLPDTGWNGAFQLEAVDPATLLSSIEAEPLQGKVELKSDLAHGQNPQDAPVDFSMALQSAGAAARTTRLHFDEITAQGQWHAQMLRLPKILVRSRGGVLQGQGSYAAPSQTAQADLKLQMPGGSGSLKGTLAPANGQGQLLLDVRQLRQAGQWLQQWPGMAALRQRQLEGAAKLQANWRGGWQNNGQAMQVDAVLDAPSVTMRSAQDKDAPLTAQGTRLVVRGRLADARIEAQSRLLQGKREVQFALQGQGGKRKDGWQAQVQTLQASLHDTLLKRRWQALLAQPVSIQIQQGAGGMRVQTSAFEMRLSGNQVQGQASILGDPVRWVQQGNSYTVSSKGRLTGLPLAWIEVLSGSAALEQALAGDMVFDGQWDVQLGAQLRLQASLARTGGDLVMLAGDSAGRGQGRIAAGVRTARIDVQSMGGNQIEARLQWDSAQAGTADAVIRTRLARSGGGWTLPGSAPLQGRIQARLPRVGVWNIFAPPGWRLRGTLQTDVAVAGTVQAPLLNGSLQADDLGLRSVVDGIAFQNGRLRAQLQGRRMVIDEFSLRGVGVQTGLLGGGKVDGGAARITGQVEWGGGGQSLAQSVQTQLTARLEKLQVSSLPDRMIVVSGDVQTRFEQLRLQMRGGLHVDRALITLPEDTAPRLDEDVVVLPSKHDPKAVQAPARPPAPAPTRSAGPALDDDVVVRAPVAPSAPASAARPAAGGAPRPQARRASRPQNAQASEAPTASPPGLQQANPEIQADIQIGIDLGPDLRVRGYGLDTRLRGKLEVQGGPRLRDQPRLVGAIRTDRGTFRAYGQDLEIESGRLVFTGPLASPALDVVAIRRNIDLRVGVRLYGSAQRPLVQLFSEPPMPDAERLSWLVLGRSSYGAADAALLQQAALALLGGKGGGVTGRLADTLGLDEIGFKGGESLSDGSITLGKRFSNRFYVGYEKSLDATLGAIHFFFDLTRTLKLRGQTGQYSAVDLIYTRSYD